MFEKNMQVLKEYYPHLYKEIIQQSQHLKYEIVTSKKGVPNLKISDINYLHSKYDPIKEAKDWINGFKVLEEDTILINGLGLGYYINPVIESYANKKIIIIEPDLDIFIHAIMIHDFTNYFKSDDIVFFVNTDSYAIENVMGGYLYENKIKHIYLTEMPVYRRIYNDYIENIYKGIAKAVLRVRGNLGTEMLSAHMWLNNTVRNIEYILEYPTINNVNSLFEGIPIVIVSAGPSLEKNMHYLKEIQNKAMIIAVGSAVNILEEHNLIPHIIMGVDGKEFEARIFSKLKNNKPLMIYANSIHYKALKAYGGKKIWMLLETEKIMQFLCKQVGINTQIFMTGPSVANTALDFACRFKPSVIMFIGQDLAYTNEKRYAAGSAHSDEDLSVFEKNSKYVIKKDIYGEDIYTKKDFVAMKDWFEDYVRVYNNKQKIYNCTEGGLNIEGIPNLPFKEAIDEWCKSELDINERLNEMLRQPISGDRLAFEELISKYKIQIIKGIELSKTRISLLEEVLKDNENIKFKEKFNTIQEIGLQLEELEVYSSLIEETGKRYIKALTVAFNEKCKNISDTGMKRKVMFEGLLQEFKYVHMNLENVKLALEGQDITYHC